MLKMVYIASQSRTPARPPSPRATQPSQPTQRLQEGDDTEAPPLAGSTSILVLHGNDDNYGVNGSHVMFFYSQKLLPDSTQTDYILKTCIPDHNNMFNN
jgi:hypothetical protein